MKWPIDLLTKAERTAAAQAGAPESLKITNLIRLLVDNPRKIRRLTGRDVPAEENLLVGLDGDDTGAVLEDLFLSSAEEITFRRLSGSVTAAIEEICTLVSARCSAESIIFAAGDDILFRGRVDTAFLDELQQIYVERTAGLTCSIGYGRSFREVYLALKLAKAQPGKNCITGVELL